MRPLSLKQDEGWGFGCSVQANRGIHVLILDLRALLFKFSVPSPEVGLVRHCRFARNLTSITVWRLHTIFPPSFSLSFDFIFFFDMHGHMAQSNVQPNHPLEPWPHTINHKYEPEKLEALLQILEQPDRIEEIHMIQQQAEGAANPEALVKAFTDLRRCIDKSLAGAGMPALAQLPNVPHRFPYAEGGRMIRQLLASRKKAIADQGDGEGPQSPPQRSSNSPPTSENPKTSTADTNPPGGTTRPGGNVEAIEDQHSQQPANCKQ